MSKRKPAIKHAPSKAKQAAKRRAMIKENSALMAARRAASSKGHARHPARPGIAPRTLVLEGFGVEFKKGNLAQAAGSEMPCVFGIRGAALGLRDALAPVMGVGTVIALRVTIERLKGGAAK